MKKLVLLITVVAFAGCGKLSNNMKHFHANMTGLHYKVTLYGQGGQPLREWLTDSKIEDQGGSIFFLYNGKATTISGTFTIEEQ